MNRLAAQHRSVTVASSDSPSVQLEETAPEFTNGVADELVPEPTSVPALRSDLKLQPVTVDSVGTPNWIIRDSLRTRYFKIGWVEYELLARWTLGLSEKIIESVNAETTLTVTRTDLSNLVEFLEHNELLVADNATALNGLLSKSERKGPTWWRRGFRSSMFIRKRLFNPDRLLTAIHFVLKPALNRSALVGMTLLCMAVVAAIGISAHAYEFKDAFAAFMNPSGLALFVLTLVFLNLLHEIGHGVVAKHFGCRVSEIGVALIFMLPVAYCDTSDAWRLSSKKKRLWINAGGIAAELVLAVFALLLWLTLPDGVPRTVAYFVAVTSAASTLLINLNPCLKFDGYYLLSDWLGIENLQKKSFDIGRWRWRQRILGDLEPVPHAVSRRELTVLHRYANFTWIYRLFLYLSICAMVYHFWFKALGIVLMLGVCFSMLIKPVANELLHYAKAIASGRVSRTRVSAMVVFTLFCCLFFIPLPRTLSIPAVISADAAGRVFNHTAGVVDKVNVDVGQSIKAGSVMLQLRVPELDFQESRLQLEISGLKDRLEKQTRWKDVDTQRSVSPAHIASKQAELEQILQEKERLALRAPFDAVVTTVPEWLKPGLWVPANSVLVEYVASGEPLVRAYLPASKLPYIENREATFETSFGSVFKGFSIKTVSTGSIEVLTDSMLSTQFGGSIATQLTEHEELKPIKGWHLVTLATDEQLSRVPQEWIGFAKLSTESHSFASSVFRRVYGVILRESGF